MQDVSSLTDRLDTEFALSEERQEKARAQHVGAYLDRQARLDAFAEAVECRQLAFEPRSPTARGRRGLNETFELEPVSKLLCCAKIPEEFNPKTRYRNWF